MQFNLFAHGGLGDCIWQFSVLPNIKEICPESHINLWIDQLNVSVKEDLSFLVDGLYDELKIGENLISLFPLSSPFFRTDIPHLMDFLQDTLEHHYPVKFSNYYKMPYTRFFIEDFKPNNEIICFCTGSSNKDILHPRNPPLKMFYELIEHMPEYNFIQIGNLNDEKINLSNVNDKRGLAFKEVVKIVANSRVFLGLQSGLRVLAESLYVPLVCFHNRSYGDNDWYKNGTWDIPLTQYNTIIINGDTPNMSYKEPLYQLRRIIEQTSSYFQKTKKIRLCYTKEDVDACPEQSSIVIDYRNVSLELYAKRVSIYKKNKVFLDRGCFKRDKFII
jgi:hypothetical protein